jgi:hypothetical protein
MTVRAWLPEELSRRCLLQLIHRISNVTNVPDADTALRRVDPDHWWQVSATGGWDSVSSFVVGRQSPHTVPELQPCGPIISFLKVLGVNR